MKVQWNKLIVGGLHLAAGALIKHGWVHASVIHWAGGIVAAAIGYVAHNPPPDDIKEDAAPLLGRALKMLLCLALPALLLTGGCTTQLAPGGAYAPVAPQITTNADGTLGTNLVATATPMPELYIADTSYKLAYQLVDGILQFEHDNRAEVAAVSPDIKKGLDAIRPTVWDIDQRWARARQAYKANPTPAGLSGLQLILPEMQRLVPVVQAAISPVYSTNAITSSTATPAK
jgi:hypothetical protein